MDKIFFKKIALLFLFSCFFISQKTKAQTMPPYTNVEGWNSIVNSSCASYLGANPYLTGLNFSNLFVNHLFASVEGSFIGSYKNGAGVDAYILTWFNRTGYDVRLKLSDGSYTPTVSYTLANNILSGTTVNGQRTLNFVVGCSVAPNTYSGANFVYYVPIDFASYVIPVGLSVVGSEVKTTTSDAPNSHNADLSKFVITSNAILAVCNAGVTAPTLSNSAISNVCPATTVNLNSIHTGTVPAFSGVSLVWFTNNTHTGAVYATPTAAGTGTYYAFYYDSVNNCYSPASVMVTVTINSCCGVGLDIPILN